MTTELLLDPDIRDWVVLPLFVIMVAAGLLRYYVGVLLAPSKIAAPRIAARAQALLRQTTKIRSSSAHYLSTWQWHVRKKHYAEMLVKEADWCESAGEQEAADSSNDDPLSAMMNPMAMMKGSMAPMIQNMVMMQGIQHFFSGFILLKVPFPLTAGFKHMFQRGLVELPDLESSYVSSVSWYFLVMYGLRSFFKLAIGEPTLELREQEQVALQLGFQNPPNPGAKGQDAESAAKMLRQEAENLELFMADHKSEFDTVEKRLLGKRYPRKKLTDDGTDFLLGPTKTKKKR